MERQPHDNYETPTDLANWMVDHGMLLYKELGGDPRTMLFLEPGCGDTAPFARRLAARGVHSSWVHTCDIRDVDPSVSDSPLFKKYDFVAEPTKDKFDLIVTNPPYGKAEAFVRQSLKILNPGGVAVFLLRVGFLESQKRYPLFRDHQPSEVHVLVSRPSFVGNGSSDSSSYGVFVWTYRSTGTQLFWLNNSGWNNRS